MIFRIGMYDEDNYVTHPDKDAVAFVKDCLAARDAYFAEFADIDELRWADGSFVAEWLVANRGYARLVPDAAVFVPQDLRNPVGGGNDNG